MESEKIKKALEDNKTDHLPYIDGWKCKFVEYVDILILINELESENAYQKEHIEMWFRKNEEKKKRVAELEKEKERLNKAISNIQKGFDNGEFISKDCKISALKQFAEMLKAKMPCEEVFKGIWGKIDETLKEFLNEKPTE